MQPLFRIYAGSQEITAAIRDRLIELVVTDEAGIQSDELKLTLDDRRREDGAIAELPRIGTVLTVSLGYAETLKRGFAVVRGDGAVVTSKAAVERAAAIEIEFADGRVAVGGRPRPKKPGEGPEQGSLF